MYELQVLQSCRQKCLKLHKFGEQEVLSGILCFLLSFYQKRYTPYMGPINIRCEKYINDSYITKQSDHYVKQGQIGLKRSAS